MAEFFNTLVEDVDFKEPKHPDQIYKINLDGGEGTKIDSKKANVAHTLVNAFVNAGYGTDVFML